MSSAIILHKISGGLCLPTCTCCLEPFEDDEQIVAFDYDPRKNLLEQDLRHEECMDYTVIFINDQHLKNYFNTLTGESHNDR